jgi:uncharacterized protein
MAEINLNPMNRRSFLKSCLGLLAVGSLMGTYSFKIERFWYQVKEVHLKVHNLPEAFKGWKIVQFSDVHFGFHYGVENFKTVVKKINYLNPDIIFFTGDLVEIGNRTPEVLLPLLSQLKAERGGKWAVIGNHDYYTKKDVTKVLNHSGFQVLNNSHGAIESNNQHLYIAGIDDVMYGDPDIGKAVEDLSEKDCIMLLAHEPDIADKTSKYPVSAQFSGHSHGGQVRIPFYGPVIRQELASKYNDGLYHVGEKQMFLYVNRGIGTTDLAVRFFCRPEISVFYL